MARRSVPTGTLVPCTLQSSPSNGRHKQSLIGEVQFEHSPGRQRKAGGIGPPRSKRRPRWPPSKTPTLQRGERP
jgi:hypothetical protein